MTTLEIIQEVGSWKLGGIYTDENASNTQGKILNLVNSARMKILSMYYMAEMVVPEIYFQRFEVTDVWQDDCPGSFVFRCPTIATLPPPKMNGLDGLFPNCDQSLQLIGVTSEQQLRSYKNHTMMKYLASNGVFVRTGNEFRGIVRGGKTPSKFLIRAVLSQPHLAPNLSLEYDPYPAPDGFVSDIKKLLDSDEGRRFMMITDQISNSKTDIEDARTAPNR
jgi:hypothetical protein